MINTIENTEGALAIEDIIPSFVGEVQNSIPKSNFLKRIELTERDLKIIEFILEMKFSSKEDVFQKFFKLTRSNHESKSLAWARKRLSQLEKAKFLKSEYNFGCSTRYFAVTFKGYYVLKNFQPEKNWIKPIGGMDIRTFDHDEKIIKIRLQLESTKKITSWLSDRKLRCFPELAGGLTGGYVPDGIYTMPDGTNIAFELEIALKGKDKYREKIRKYICLLKSSGSEKPFSKVHFVYAKDIVGKHLMRETKLYPELFTIESLANYQPLQTNINLTRKG